MVTARAIIFGVGLVAALCFPAHAEELAPHAAVVIERENIVEMQSRGQTWKKAELGAQLAEHEKLRTGEFSRAAVQLTDRSTLRLDELTTIEISSNSHPATGKTLEVKKGTLFFYNRDKPQGAEIHTAAANGAIRGTEFAVHVAADGKTTLSMLEGEVELSNARGKLLLRSGEQGEAEIGKAPRKTAMIEAINVIQWCLYYPAVLDPAELSPGESRALTAYREGDLATALAVHSLLHGATVDERLFHAAVILASGQVGKAKSSLSGVPHSDPRRRALEEMIAAVQFRTFDSATTPGTASEWLAHSYYTQSRGDLDAALQAARRAVEISPRFGYAWTRMAELEFSFGRTPRAMQMNERGLAFTPRNAQAHSLQGFLLSAENRIGAARRSFDAAIALDGSLGNAWLGRGLTAFRQGREAEGRRDLQVAAALEPNRSILRSYLGKAFSAAGIDDKAQVEFDRAKEIDPADPTPWLYSAIQLKQQNRYNEAIAEIERSMVLNDNRGVFRSRFLLDQDLAVRGVNIASLYKNNGLIEQSVRDAQTAVNYDYSSGAAHLFLSDSYDALRDPARVLARYETAWSSERLLANLLSPVGSGPLSQFVSAQEYSKLLAGDGLGIALTTEYFSNGELRETGSQYGTFGNLSYALDAEYRYSDGTRPNNSLSRLETYATFKLQLGPQDTVFFQTKYGEQLTGNVFPYRDPRDAERTVVKGADGWKTKIPNIAALTHDTRETQDPGVMLLGWRHEWSPGNHTLLLLSRLGNEQEQRNQDAGRTAVSRDVAGLAPHGIDLSVGQTIPRDEALFSMLDGLTGRGKILRLDELAFDLEYRSSFQIASGELQHIFTLGPHTAIVGGRYQRGDFDARVRLTDFGNNLYPDENRYFRDPPAKQSFEVDFERTSLYLYDTWKVAPWLWLTGGVSWDRVEYPENFRSPPINGRQASLDKVSPKIGVTALPWRGATIRGAYAEAVSGASFDESIRLEPTQVAGFLQSYRTLASEALVGSASGNEYRFSGLSVEQKLPSRTYLGMEMSVLEQDVEQATGVLDLLTTSGTILGIVPSSLPERESYREESITATIHRLIGERWAFGLRYRYTHSELTSDIRELNIAARHSADASTSDGLRRLGHSQSEAGLHSSNLSALYNHPSGFFARAEANWYRQDNDELTTGSFVQRNINTGHSELHSKTHNRGQPGEDFWQFNFLAGYRFHRNQCEVSGGVLNLTGADYLLNPLNPYNNLVRDRTLVVRCKFQF